jgi:hypothetical protein
LPGSTVRRRPGTSSAKTAEAIEYAKTQLAKTVKIGSFKKDAAWCGAMGTDQDLSRETLNWMEDRLDVSGEHDWMEDYVFGALIAVSRSDFWEAMIDAEAEKQQIAPKKYKNHQKYWGLWGSMVRDWFDRTEMPPQMKEFTVNFMCSFQEAIQKRKIRPSQSPFKWRNQQIAGAVEYVALKFSLNARRGSRNSRTNESACSIVSKALAQLGIHMGEFTIQSIYDEEAQSEELCLIRKVWRMGPEDWERERQHYRHDLMQRALADGKGSRAWETARQVLSTQHVTQGPLEYDALGHLVDDDEVFRAITVACGKQQEKEKQADGPA